MPDTLSLVTTVLAAWGAGLSTFSFWRSRRDQQPRLQVIFGPGITENKGRPRERVMAYGVTVNNIGLRNVYFEDYRSFLRIEGLNKDLHFDQAEEAPALPSILEPGQSFMAYIMRDEFHRLVKRHKGDITHARIKGGVVDAIGRKFASKWVHVTAIDTKDLVSNHGLFDRD